MDPKVLADTKAKVVCPLPIELVGMETEITKREGTRFREEQGSTQSPRDRAGHKFRSFSLPSNLFRALILAQETQRGIDLSALGLVVVGESWSYVKCIHCPGPICVLETNT